MNNYCTFYILRHGLSQGNIDKIHGGDQPLSLEGIEQAQKRAKNLSETHFDKIFSSDLLRAKQTAEILALEHRLEVMITKAIRERVYGILEGTSIINWTKEIRDVFTTWYNKEYEERLKEKVVEGMETDEEMLSRTFLFLRKAAVAYPGKTILVVTHGDLMQTLLVHLGYGKHKEFAFYCIRNTGYFVLKSDGVDFFVEGVQDIQLTKNE